MNAITASLVVTHTHTYINSFIHMLRIAITLLNKLSSYRELFCLYASFNIHNALSAICVHLNFVCRNRVPLGKSFSKFFNHIIHDCLPPIYHHLLPLCGLHHRNPSLFPSTQNGVSALISRELHVIPNYMREDVSRELLCLVKRYFHTAHTRKPCQVTY